MTNLKEALSEIDTQVLDLEYVLLRLDRLGDSSKADKKKSINIQQEPTENVDYYAVGRDSLERGLYLGMGYALMREAYRLFLLGAYELKCPKCWYGIGICLYHGYGVEPDRGLGEKILSENFEKIKSLENDNEASVILHEYYEYGYGVDVNHEKALTYLEGALCPRGYYLLAAFDKHGPSNMLTKSYEENYPLSYYALGKLYRFGKYKNNKKTVSVSLDKAKEYLVAGAEQGYPACRLGLYELSLLNEGFDIEDGVLIKCSLHKDTVHVPEIVKEIRPGAFQDARIDTIYLPDSMDEPSTDIFNPKHLPSIVSSRFNTDAYRAKVIAKNMGVRAKNTVNGFFRNRPTTAWSIILFIFLGALISALHFTSIFPINLPRIVPLIAYGIGLVMTVVFVFKDYSDVTDLFVYAPTTLFFTFFAFYGGVINYKWSFIPFSVALLILSLVVVGSFIDRLSFNGLNFPILVTGSAVIFGGVITGAFTYSFPSVAVIVAHSVFALVAIVAFIVGTVSCIKNEFLYENPAILLVSPVVLSSIIGFCFSGSYAGWGHFILLTASFALTATLVILGTDEIKDIFEYSPAIGWGVLIGIFLALIGTALGTSGAISFNFPGVVPLIFYIVGAIVAFIATVWYIVEEGFDGSAFVFIVPFVLLVAAIFFGGIIGAKWSFIPIGVVVLLLTILLDSILIYIIKVNVVNVSAILTGCTVIFGGIITHAFSTTVPGVPLLVTYSIFGAIGLVFVIAGFISAANNGSLYENPTLMASSPIIILSLVGICFSGSFAGWGHFILLTASFALAATLVILGIDEIKDTFEYSPAIGWGVLIGIFLALIGTALGTSGAISFNFPGVVPLIFYIVGAIVALIATVWYINDEGFDGGVFAFIVPLLIFLVAIFFGGVINAKWSFIPVSIELIAFFVFLAFALYDFLELQAVNIAIILSGSSIIFGGIISGAFQPSLVDIGSVAYGVMAFIGICMFITGFSFKDSAVTLALPPLILIPIIGICFCGVIGGFNAILIVGGIISLMVCCTGFRV